MKKNFKSYLLIVLLTLTSCAHMEESGKPSDQSQLAGDPSEMSLDSVDVKYRPFLIAYKKDQEKALTEEAAQVLSKNPHDLFALNGLAIYHYQKGRVGAAKFFLGKALEKEKGSASLFNNLAVILMSEGEFGEALLNLKSAYKIEDRNPYVLANLGSYYLVSGDSVKALPLLEQANRKMPSNSFVANNFAVAQMESKNFPKAKEILEGVLDKDSKNVDAMINYSILLIEYLNQPKDGLSYVYKVKFLETDRQDVLSRANALEKLAKSRL